MWFGIHFANSAVIYKIVCIALIAIIFLIVRWYKSVRRMQALSSARLRTVVFFKSGYIYRALKYILYALGVCSLLIIILQPQWGKKEESIQQEGRDVLIAVDISRSMLCSDQKPNRLEFVKQKVRKMLSNLSCERVGLILFAGDSVVQCPLTIDYNAFFMFLDNLDVETVASGTTTLDGAVQKALNIFEQMPEKKSKILCIFTDGEDFSTNLARFKDQAIAQGLSIFTFGVGTKRGAPIPIVDNKGKNRGFEKDDKGTIIMSKLNEGILKNLSEQTGGTYIHLESGDKDIAQFIRLVEKFEKDSMENVSMQQYVQQYWYFAVVSFICLGLEWLL
ncbi:VWA domain-containing protein [Candidatus Babeliales bacterium]|nr:VWA domain-containing protein [Candidatus Babeliales bacterium]